MTDGGYLASIDPATFDPLAYLASFDRELLDAPEGRRELTKFDPLLFGLLYVPRHLKSAATGHAISFGEPHLAWYRLGRRWAWPTTGPRQERYAELAPRETGKTTTWFLIVPLWAAAHGHIRFAAAFADSATQAEQHLTTFRRELERNPLLRLDFPALCAPARRNTGVTLADSRGMLTTKSGFSFAARGIDSSNLGLKVEEARPDLLLLDDVESDEENYSPYQAKKRLGTITDAILPLSEYARVVLSGTVTMPGSITHQLVRHASGVERHEWIDDQRFEIHHHRPILTNPDGSERSCWPAKWSLDYLNSIRHTRSYAKNYDNDPKDHSGGYWSKDDFTYGPLPGVTRVILRVDPATTTGQKSDFTGLAVIGWAPPRRRTAADITPEVMALPSNSEERLYAPSRCIVLHAEDVKLVGEPLRTHVLHLLARFQGVGAVVVESNQGGEHWGTILHDLPVPLMVQHATDPKEVRFAQALHYYQARPTRVLHAQAFHRAETQMTAFPLVDHDDIADAICSGVLDFLKPKPIRRRPRTLNPT